MTDPDQKLPQEIEVYEVGARRLYAKTIGRSFALFEDELTPEELMAIARGTKTVEQTRAQTNIRKIKHRKAVRSGTDGSTLVAAIDEGAADSDAAAMTRPRKTNHEKYLEGIRNLARTLEVMCGVPIPRFDPETFGGVIEAIHEVEAALSEFKEKVVREGEPAQEGDAAAPAEQPADVIEPDCDGELVWCSSES